MLRLAYVHLSGPEAVTARADVERGGWGGSRPAGGWGRPTPSSRAALAECARSKQASPLRAAGAAKAAGKSDNVQRTAGHAAQYFCARQLGAGAPGTSKKNKSGDSGAARTVEGTYSAGRDRARPSRGIKGSLFPCKIPNCSPFSYCSELELSAKWSGACPLHEESWNWYFKTPKPAPLGRPRVPIDDSARQKPPAVAGKRKN